MCRLQRHSLQRIYVILPPSKCEVSPTNTVRRASRLRASENGSERYVFDDCICYFEALAPASLAQISVIGEYRAPGGLFTELRALFEQKETGYCWKHTARSEMNRETHSALLELVSRTVHG